jgi:dTDP-4-amino-4,6-dideoxygalactose transaminase
MLVSANADLLESARRFRDYGKPDYSTAGLNFRMAEFTAALGIVAVERMDEIAAWKNDVARRLLDASHPARIMLPKGMTSGLYKYIVFDEIELSTGRVYAEPCHRIMRHSVSLPNTDWVAENHWCVPLYYRPHSEVAS